MAAAAEITVFKNGFEKFRVLVSDVERDLKELKEKVPKLQKSLDTTLITVANQVGLFTALNNAVLVFFSGAARGSIPCFAVSFVTLILIAFLFGVAMPLAYGYWRIRIIKSGIRSFLREVRNLKFKVHGVHNTYADNVVASQDIEGVTEELRAEVQALGYRITNLTDFQEVFGTTDGLEILQAADRVYIKIIWVIAFCALVYAFIFPVVASVLFCEGRTTIF